MRFSTNTSYLERHGNKWRVTMSVPADLKKELGTKLKRPLNTDSLSRANQLKVRVVQELLDLIEQTRGTKTGERKALLREAGQIAEMRAGLDEGADDDIARAITARTYEILGAPTTVIDDEGPREIYSAEKEALVGEYRRIAAGKALPIRIEYDDFVERILKKERKLKPRSLDDYDRAMDTFDRWRTRKKLPDDLHAVTTKVAKSFAEDLPTFEGDLQPATCAKYVGCLRQYFERIVYLEWLPANCWHSVKVVVPEIPHDEAERPFTDDEVRRLLIGQCEPHLKDLIYVGALTGARLDAIVDLRVQDCLDGHFTFKAQKLEPRPRDVPIHSMLLAIVARRTEGRKPNDWLFPEYPPAGVKGSLKEHSAQATKAFTKYRRRIGVDEVVEGKRRALVNFHSFRRWFITRAEQADQPENIIKAVVGHKRQGITLSKYSAGPELRQAKRVVESVKLPALDKGPVPEPRIMMPRRGTE